MRYLRLRLMPWLLALGCSWFAQAEEPRLNEIQVIGSHNSYHLAPPSKVMDLIGSFRKDAVEAWSYSHPAISEQLEEHGIRQFELDVYHDPDGGLYMEPLMLKLAGDEKLRDDFDPDGDLKKPGFKILHVPDIDCWSNSPSLRSAMEEFAKWSDAHENHLPVMILIECKDAANPPLPTRPAKFTRDVMLELEKEILTYLPVRKIIRPDDIRGSEKSLPAALSKNGWPLLSESKGKFLFMIDNEGALRNAYLKDNQNLAGRLFFVSAQNAAHPAAAWFKINNPVRDSDRIKRLVRDGFLVRTRADGMTADAKTRDSAFESGAQWISTDHFSVETPELQRVAFLGGKMVRGNPISGKAGAVIDP